MDTGRPCVKHSTHWGSSRVIQGLHWDNGKENGNYRDDRGYIGIIGCTLGLYWDNGKQNANYLGFRVGSCILWGFWAYREVFPTPLCPSSQNWRRS